VFNRDYTQYMPLQIPDLQRLIGQPGMFIFDCDHAGHLVPMFEDSDEAFASYSHTSRGTSDADPALIDGSDPRYRKEWIVFASCGPLETLPTSPDYPADLFTSCLTTPLKVALRFAIQVRAWACRECFAPFTCWVYAQRKSPILPTATVDLVDRIPGELSDRHTPLGELNWVFTTITDTIAWSVCPRPLFLRLFRHDLCVAPLFRNFLFADRMMRVAGVTPLSYPKLPPTHLHPLWDSFDVAVDLLLCRTIQMEATQAASAAAARKSGSVPSLPPNPAPPTQSPPVEPQPPAIERLVPNKRLEEEMVSPAKSTKSSGTAKSDRKKHGKDGKEKKHKKASGKDAESKTGKSKGHKKHKNKDKGGDGDSVRRQDKDGRASAVASVAGDPPQPPPLFPPTTFFDEQLTAFSMWVQYGKHSQNCTPPQLPVLLQVRMSPCVCPFDVWRTSSVHPVCVCFARWQSLLTQERRHALMLLARFMDLGAWAVRCSLEVGMFPYILKLLKVCSHDLVVAFSFALFTCVPRDPAVCVRGYVLRVGVCHVEAVGIRSSLSHRLARRRRPRIFREILERPRSRQR
jgi:hypothetical protein